MENTCIKISFVLVLISVFMSCKKGNTYYEDYKLDPPQYNGTSLQFLESQANMYDSLLLVLDRIPALRTKLNTLNDTTTFFAVTNNSFKNAIEGLNTIRKSNGRSPMYIEDIPQAVLDSTIHHYIFKQMVSTDDLKPFVEGIELRSLNNYRMHLQYDVTSSSGFIGGGQQQIRFSDMNNSIFYRYWQDSFTSVVNIKTKNGYVHILAPGHNFGFSKLTSQLSSN